MTKRAKNANLPENSLCSGLVKDMRWPILAPAPLAEEQVPTKSIGETCRKQARALIELLGIHSHKMLQNGETAKSVFDSLFARQFAYPAA